MRRKGSSAEAAAEFTQALTSFERVVTATEVIMGARDLVDRLSRTGGSSPGRDEDRSSLRRSVRAFQLARRRHEWLAAGADRAPAARRRVFDATFSRELDRAGAGTAAAPTAVAHEDGKRPPPVRSVAELVGEAHEAVRMFDFALANSPHGDDEFLSPDGSGDAGTPPPADGGGGGGSSDTGSPPPTEPVGTELPPSFDQYPPGVQEEARSHFEEEVEEPVKQVIGEGMASIAAGGQVSMSNVNASIAGIVAGAAAGIGGPVGAGIAAFALLVIPVLLAALEEAIEKKLKGQPADQ